MFLNLNKRNPFFDVPRFSIYKLKKQPFQNIVFFFKQAKYLQGVPHKVSNFFKINNSNIQLMFNWRKNIFKH